MVHGPSKFRYVSGEMYVNVLELWHPQQQHRRAYKWQQPQIDGEEIAAACLSAWWMPS